MCVYVYARSFVKFFFVLMRDFTTQNKCFSNYTQYNEKGFKMYNSIHTHTHLHEEEEVTRLLIFYLVVVVVVVVVVVAVAVVINQTVHRLPWYPLRLRTSL